jgi:hypothetical protein
VENNNNPVDINSVVITPLVSTTTIASTTVDIKKLNIEDVKAWKTFSDPRFKFTFNYPAYWDYKIEEFEDGPRKAVFYSQNKESELHIALPIPAVGLEPFGPNIKKINKTNNPNTDLKITQWTVDGEAWYDGIINDRMTTIEWENGKTGNALRDFKDWSDKSGWFILQYNNINDDYYGYIVNKIISSFKFVNGAPAASTIISTSKATSSVVIGETKKEIDTSNWQTYKNNEYGFDIKYPQDWELDNNKNQFLIGSSKWREGLPEGGGGVEVLISNVSLKDYIKEYESDLTGDGQPISKILSQQDYNLGGKMGTKLIGSTAIGIDQNIIFIPTAKGNFIITFHDFDEKHLEILSTFNFIK